MTQTAAHPFTEEAPAGALASFLHQVGIDESEIGACPTCWSLVTGFLLQLGGHCPWCGCRVDGWKLKMNHRSIHESLTEA